ncbi:glycosyltransferase family 2 protein [Bradyrhizobium archetypum]|uniref:Glycosyltransferase family 2 protein n=1 Tax=Bradyrhizobium archetypum TaxID=2721160 RepID=A0A7Y4M2A8_9BRAD|nr:glycosyltransferase family A protein [Bradyrhizobium archetypum]NOJ47563.1 glycosyltransferase family 2 protein [Bradyrhizobium archetypum]
MTADTFAALVPLYNKEPYVARAITSILAQTRPVDEIIIVDDASTDGSIDQVTAFQDPRLRLLRRTDPKQRGLPATRNLGIQSATSRWIALLDADDSWHGDYIEEIEKLLTQATDRTGMLFTGFENIWSDGIVTQDSYSASCDDQRFTHLSLDRFVSDWLRIGGCPVIPSAVVLRRDMLLEAGLFKECCRRGEDKEMWLRLLSISDALASPRVCSSYYRAIPGQMQDSVTTNARHCVCATLEDMIARASGTRRRLLKRLFNMEVFEYARGVQQRERVSPEIYRGFFVSVEPQRYFVLLLLSYVPVPIQKLIRRFVLWTSGVIGLPNRRIGSRFR